MKPQNGYLAFYGSTTLELYADTQAEARQQAIAKLHLKPQQEHKLSIHLAERAGQPVVHTADF